jgi:UDP-glucose 4-epimerase
MGSHLTESLVDRGYEVTVFDNLANGTVNLECIKGKIKIIKGDFLNETEIDQALHNIDYVFHYLSTTVPATAKVNPIFDIESNIIGSVRLLQKSVNNKIKKIFFSSSGGTIYGEPTHLPIRETDAVNPLDPYAISKLTIEKYLNYFYQSQGLDYTIIRYSNPYGERQNPLGKQGVIPIFLFKIKTGDQPQIYGDGSMLRDYIYIKDAISATIAILERGRQEKIFNVGRGEGQSLNDLIKIMAEVTGKKIVPRYTAGNENYIQKIVLDSSKLQKETGWKAETKLQEGIRRTWTWLNRCF